ncbi:hypothetical protein OHB24_41570 [Kribbella sp. NBC_00482]|uniref:hypothetical protein n=1 Tax=Kribbella sp. NBC_00482 TaxID=2975968 RepID=UPI002E179583
MHSFEELMGEVMATAERFGHREHVRLTWLAVRRSGTAGAVELTAYQMAEAPDIKAFPFTLPQGQGV